MAFIVDEDDRSKPIKVRTRIVQNVSRFRKKQRHRMIEAVVDGDLGKKTVRAYYDKHGNVNKEVYHAQTLIRNSSVLDSKKDKRRILRAVKQFLRLNPKVRLTELGLKKIILDDVAQEVVDEEI